MNISISSAHGLRVRGAKGPSPWGLDEVDESRRVTDRVAELLRGVSGVNIRAFHDDKSGSVGSNLAAINSFHGQRANDRHVSVHFNAHSRAGTDRPIGTEVCHRNQPALAAVVSKAIADAGQFINRGAKTRSNLSFLNRNSNAVLLEVCFVDSRRDCELYRAPGAFEAICRGIASSISGRTIGVTPSTPAPVPTTPATRPTLRNGARGDDVRILQTALVITADGVFGPRTEAAVRIFQAKHDLVADGIVGPRTWAVLEREFKLN